MQSALPNPYSAHRIEPTPDLSEVALPENKNSDIEISPKDDMQVFRERLSAILDMNSEDIQEKRTIQDNSGGVIWYEFTMDRDTRPGTIYLYSKAPDYIEKGYAGEPAKIGSVREQLLAVCPADSSEEMEYAYYLYDEVVSPESVPELYERLQVEDAYAKKLSRRTPLQHAEVLGIEYEELFPDGKDVLVVGDPAATLARYDLGCRLVLQDYEFIEQIAPPIIDILNPQDSDLSPSKRFNSWLDSVFNYDMRSLMREGYDAEHPHETASTWYHNYINEMWEILLEFVDDFSEASYESRGEIISEAHSALLEMRKKYDAGYSYGDLFYYPNRNEKWKQHVANLAKFAEAVRDERSVSLSLSEQLKGRTIDRDGEVVELDDTARVELAEYIAQRLQVIVGLTHEMEGIKPLAGNNKINLMMKARAEIMSAITKLDPEAKTPTDLFKLVSPELRILDEVKDLYFTNQPNYGEIVASDLADMYERLITYFELMYPHLEKDFLDIKKLLDNDRAYFFTRVMEEKWWKTQFSRSQVNGVPLVGSFFPDKSMEPESFDRIVGVYSVSTHAWDVIKDPEDFEQAVEDSLKLLREGGKMYVGPLNYRKERVMKNADEAYRSATFSNLGYPILAGVLDRFHQQGILDYQYGILDSSTGRWVYEETKNSPDALEEKGYASYLMIEKK